MDQVTLPRSVLLVLTGQLRSALQCLADLGRADGGGYRASDEHVAVIDGSRRQVVDMVHARTALELAERVLKRPPRTEPAPLGHPSSSTRPNRPMAPPVGGLSRLPRAASVSPAVQRRLATVVDLKAPSR